MPSRIIDLSWQTDKQYKYRLCNTRDLQIDWYSRGRELCHLPRTVSKAQLLDRFFWKNKRSLQWVDTLKFDIPSIDKCCNMYRFSPLRRQDPIGYLCKKSQTCHEDFIKDTTGYISLLVQVELSLLDSWKPPRQLRWSYTCNMIESRILAGRFINDERWELHIS